MGNSLAATMWTRRKAVPCLRKNGRDDSQRQNENNENSYCRLLHRVDCSKETVNPKFLLLSCALHGQRFESYSLVRVFTIFTGIYAPAINSGQEHVILFYADNHGNRFSKRLNDEMFPPESNAFDNISRTKPEICCAYFRRFHFSSSDFSPLKDFSGPQKCLNAMKLA